MFKTPLRKRLSYANRRKERYWTDADYRLRLVNDKRARRGQEPLTALEQIGEDFRASLASKRRDERGRFA